MDRVQFFDFPTWGTEVHDPEWLTATSGFMRGAKIIDGRGEAGPHYFELAPGAGRNGNTALRMVLTNSSGSGSPDFWGLIYDRNNATAGAAYSNPSTANGYTVPRGKQANRIHFWVKFPSGYRQAMSAHPSTQQNMHFGTYHFDPAAIDGSTDVVEGNNWHHYHQFVIRHDLAQNDWVHICLNQTCTNMRSFTTQIPATNHTAPVGSYMETLTRWYLSPVPYGPFGSPPQGGTTELSGPFEILIDSIYTEYVEEYHPINIQIENWSEGQVIDVSGGATTPRWNVNFTNTTSSPVSGMVVVRDIQSAGRLYIPSTSTNVHNSMISFTANESRNYELQFTTISGFSKTAEQIVFYVEVYNATGGTFTITGTSNIGEGPYTTAPIAYNATPTDVKNALEAAFLVGTGFTVTGSVGKYRIERSSSGSWRNWLVSSTSSVTGTDARVCLRYSSALPMSIDFIASTEEVNGRYGSNMVASKADARVCYDSTIKSMYLGPPDADVCTTVFVANFWDRVPPQPSLYVPHTSDGGKTGKGSKNTTFNKQLHYNDLNGLPVSFELIDYRTHSDLSTIWSLNPGGLTLSSNGLLSFVPDAEWTGEIQVRFRLNNGTRTSRDFAYFIRITSNARLAIASSKFYTIGGNLLTIG